MIQDDLAPRRVQRQAGFHRQGLFVQPYDLKARGDADAVKETVYKAPFVVQVLLFRGHILDRHQFPVIVLIPFERKELKVLHKA